jgi:hypothetical protein
MGQLTSAAFSATNPKYRSDSIGEQLVKPSIPEGIGTFSPTEAQKKQAANDAFFNKPRKIVGASEIQIPPIITKQMMASFAIESLAKMTVAEITLFAKRVASGTAGRDERILLQQILHLLDPSKFGPPDEYYLVLDDSAKKGNAIEENGTRSEINTKDTLLDGSEVIKELQENVPKYKDRIRNLLNRNVSLPEVNQVVKTGEATQGEPEGTKKSNVLRSTKLGKTYPNKINTATPQQGAVTPSTTEEVPLVAQVESSVEKTEKIETAQTIPNEIPEVTPSAETQTSEIVNETVTNTEENEVQENTPEEKPTQASKQEEVIPVEIITPVKDQSGGVKNMAMKNPFVERLTSPLAPATSEPAEPTSNEHAPNEPSPKNKQELRLGAVNKLLEPFMKGPWQKLATPDRRSFSSEVTTHPEELSVAELKSWDDELSSEAIALRNDLVTI